MTVPIPFDLPVSEPPEGGWRLVEAGSLMPQCLKSRAIDAPKLSAADTARADRMAEAARGYEPSAPAVVRKVDSCAHTRQSEIEWSLEVRSA